MKMEKNNYYTANAENNLKKKTDTSSVTKIHFVDVLYDRLGLSRTEALAVVEAIFTEIQNALVEGRDVKLANFGTFSIRDKNARPGRNPKTGEEYEVSARRVVTFVPAPFMRDAVVEYGQTENKEEEK
jgi:integration host factor subunit alpha